MQVYKSRPAVRLRHGQLGRGINDLLLQLGFDKSIIEICGGSGKRLVRVVTAQSMPHGR